jgi:hypothetical protein
VQAVVNYVRDSVAAAANTLPFATPTKSGVVIVGPGLSIDEATGILTADVINPKWSDVKDDGTNQNKAANAYATASYIHALQSQIDVLTSKITALEGN